MSHTPAIFRRADGANLQPPPVGVAAGDATQADCIDLLAAVESRLRALVRASSVQSVAGSIDAGVLECAAALRRLQWLIACERRRSMRIDAMLRDSSALLAQTRCELDATRREERRARHRSLHDGLTALPNRSLFRQRLDTALTRDPGCPTQAVRGLAVLYLDLDGMKAVNDTHGHGIGDQVLRIVAARLMHAVRGDDVVSRQGGDEFAMLMTGLPDDDRALAVIGDRAEGLRWSIAVPLRIGALEVAVKASIGIAVYPRHGRQADTLLRHADLAMYRAKRSRGGFAFFEPGDAA